MTSRQAHWNEVYATKAADKVSWFQARAEISMRLIAAAGANEESAIIDIGSGVSVLVDQLVDAGFGDVTALDISERALRLTKDRLGSRAGEVHWIVSDVLAWTPARAYDIWHDRAVFHFLTDEAERSAYRAVLTKGLRKGGTLILGSFAKDGPDRCSGLPVHRWSADALARELGQEFRLIESLREDHRTPGGAVQPFIWARFMRV
jgi:trans-aconitate methyltransferase